MPSAEEKHCTLRVILPPPHSTEQGVHCPNNQLKITQGAVLHCIVSCGFVPVQSEPFTAVPFWADTQVAVRDVQPPPQLAEHLAQFVVCQAKESQSSPVQAFRKAGLAPLHLSALTLCRVMELTQSTERLSNPAPHDDEQLLQSPTFHEKVSQGATLHCRDEDGFTGSHNCSSALFRSESMHSTVRVCTPPPHSSVHALQSPTLHS
mmetsp:Transcript_29032/g.74559  ORF Transcript_29032/g.74559 Transcript_29032/m.74559 type:complete len:206 (+) Transcript_29032:1924-2541(+)